MGSKQIYVYLKFILTNVLTREDKWLPIAGDAIIGIFYKQALKFAILLCSWLNFGWLLPGGYVYDHLFL